METVEPREQPPGEIPRFRWNILSWLRDLWRALQQRRLAEQRRKAKALLLEAAVGPDKALEEEVAALLDLRDVKVPDVTLDVDDILDSERLVSYLADVGVASEYQSYQVRLDVDGPRRRLRTRIWQALPEGLQAAIRKETLGKAGAKVSPALALQLVEALNAIIEGGELLRTGQQRSFPP